MLASASAAVVDEFLEAANSIREAEREMRNCRLKMIETGRLDLARQMLETPHELKELAKFLWYGEPILIAEETIMPSRPLKSWIRCQVTPRPINREFSKQFLLERSDDGVHDLIDEVCQAMGEMRRLTKFSADALTSSWDAVKPMIATKIKSDFLDRSNVARRGGEVISQQKMIRELVIETARFRYPLEECATIFPDAALAGDYDFIKRIVDRWTEPVPLDLQYLAIAFFWHGFESVGLGGQVPPLRHWSDKAACEFVSFICGESLSIHAYKACKKKLGLRSDKPKLVTFATYTRRGKGHLLHCELIPTRDF